MELHYANANYSEIGQAIGLSRTQVRKIIEEELSDVRQARRALTEKVFEADLERLNRIMRSAWLAFNAPCVECRGIGVFQNDEGVCPRCNGDGKMYPLDDRLKAMREARQVIAERARLLGHYAPEKTEVDHTISHTVDFRAHLSSMDDETLVKSFPMYDNLIKTIDGIGPPVIDASDDDVREIEAAFDAVERALPSPEPIHAEPRNDAPQAEPVPVKRPAIPVVRLVPPSDEVDE